jgi:selenocysteine-specific elongation factor
VHVIATAGHVDHGKSTLIRALTGMEPDRWAEEQRRGMTIDLGYAWTTLDEGTTIAFVDVPGHQRFITNMLAGIGPVPAVLFVVAADEGWSRQSAEHLDALTALDVRHGVLAVTRSDLADGERAIAEAREYLAGTPLEGIEAVAVSPVAGTGLDELRAALARLTAGLPAPNSGATRLWVDRVFTVRGAGTVVTGTLGSGILSVDDEVMVASTGETVRIRGLESLKRPLDSATAVARVAVNLRGVKRSDIRRGDALVGPGQWANATAMDVRLVNLSGKPPAEPILHIGSAAVPVRLRRLDDDTARLSWDSPLPMHVGERAILRDPGPQHVLAGVVVLDVYPPALNRRGAAAARALELSAMTGRPDPAAEVGRRGAVRRSALRAAGILTDGSPAPKGAVAVGDWLIDAATWRGWQERLGAAVTAWVDNHPLTIAMPRAAAVRALMLPDAALLEPIVAQLPDLASDGDGIHFINATLQLPPAVRAALDALEVRLAANAFDAAEADQLAAAGLTERHLAIAVRNGELLRVADGIYLLPGVINEALKRLAALAGPFTLSEARQALGTTRRVAVPLLELLDKRQLTRRTDTQHRVLAR